MARQKGRKNVSQKQIMATIMVLLLLLIGYWYEKEYGKNSTMLPQVEGELKVCFLDVGQADCIFITQNGENMLIDAGNNADGSLIVEFLKSNGIEEIDYLIGTHPHEDHIGGLDVVIRNMKIGKIFMPKQKATSKTFQDVLNAIEEKKGKVTAPKVGYTFSLGDAICEVMSIENGVEEANESSLVLEITFGSQKFLFTGDMEKVNEEKRDWNDIDVLKVAHHASNTSSSRNFLRQVMPEIAVVSVGEGNEYGHPHDEVVERLNEIGAVIYRTDLDGTILLTSDGEKNAITKLDVVCDGDR